MTTSTYQVLARVDLLGTVKGGLKGSMPAGTPSILVEVDSDIEGDENKRVTLGTMITPTDGSNVYPGATGIECRMVFWADVARIYVPPGTHFDLRYSGRQVGEGTVLSIIPFYSPSDTGSAS